jgi:hypothetical protein
MIFALGHKRSQSPATALVEQRLLTPPPPPPPPLPSGRARRRRRSLAPLTIHRRREERERGGGTHTGSPAGVRRTGGKGARRLARGGGGSRSRRRSEREPEPERPRRRLCRGSGRCSAGAVRKMNNRRRRRLAVCLLRWSSEKVMVKKRLDLV